MNKSDVVVKWRDQQPDEHVVWVLLDGEGTKNIVGVTSDWKVKERWEEGHYGSESYFVDDENAGWFFDEEPTCEWEIGYEEQPICGEQATFASHMPGVRPSYLCTEHAKALKVPIPSDTLYRIDEYGDPLDGEDDIEEPEDLPFLPLPEKNNA